MITALFETLRNSYSITKKIQILYSSVNCFTENVFDDENVGNSSRKSNVGKLESLIDLFPLADVFQMSQLTDACRKGNVKLVNFLIEKGCNLDLIEADSSPLLAACTEGRGEIVRILLNQGASLDITDSVCLCFIIIIMINTD